MKNTTIIIALTFFLFACGSTGTNKKNEPVNKETPKVETPKNKNPKIKNDIQIKENGLTISEAYLTKPDGSAITNENKPGINEYVSLNLRVHGWKVINGRVKLGVSEKIETNDGKLVLDEPDLFINLKDASAKDAEIIAIDAIITELTRSIDYFNVSFRVWDKNSGAELTGSYKLELK